MITGFLSALISPIPAIESMPELKGVYEIKLPRKLTDAEFLEFCSANSEILIEQDKNGKLIIMAPIGYGSGYYEGELFGELRSWCKTQNKGFTFTSSTGFRLPNGAIRSPDAAWVNDEKHATLTSEQIKTFAPIVPDFIIEVRSNSDRISRLKKKMKNTWMKNGVRLAWLIDPVKEKTYIYRQGKKVETLNGFDHVLSGEDVCEGFELDLGELKKL